MRMTKEKIIEFLSSEDPKQTEDLFRMAREAREDILGNKIFAYGFVYFTTWCKNNCAFCYFRKSNDIPRIRKTYDEVLDLSTSLAESGVNLIDLTMGEDPEYIKEDFATLNTLIKDIKKQTGLPVMISPGVVGRNVIDNLFEAGADWYALYQETHNRELFGKLRLSQDYDERMDCKLYAKDKGMLIEEGIMSGIGESDEDVADSIIKMGEIGADQVRVMSFVPQKGSPMENAITPGRMKEYKIIALMRLMYPYALIPASLDVDGIEGLKTRIDAGANLVTSIIPPKTGLGGVAQSSKDVDEGGRTVEEVAGILGTMNLRIATNEEYNSYIGELRCRN